MFLSQKGSLGRNPMINRVGQRLLQLFEGASAAYSLRDLASNIASVVRVRRASDNSEKDFSAADVSSGAMTQWVNGQVVPPLDVRELVDGERTGALIPAAAAYSLRNLSTSYTGNVVDVRRSSDDAEDSFTAAEVADGTLADWVTEEQVGWNVQPTWDVSSGDGVISSQSSTATTSTFSITTTSGSSFVRQTSKPNHIIASSGDQVVANITISGLDSDAIARLRTSGTNTNVATVTLTNGTADYTLNLTGSAGYFVFSAIEATSGATITINSIKVIGQSGFVTQWYDQSGNDNHATQGTNASQPKIVDAGSLVSGGLDFDGVDDYLVTTQGLIVEISQNPASVFCVAHPNNTGEGYLLTEGDRISPYSSQFILNGASTGASTVWVNTTEFGSGFPASKTLGGFIYNGTTFQAYLNGSADGSAGTADINAETFNQTFIATRADATTNFFGGKVEELITYKSDQSDNRTAFEANIGETYGIDLPSGVDTGYDEVDGFVETWYDQSGNGNDATQLTASNQPRIVIDGELIMNAKGFPSIAQYRGGAGTNANRLFEVNSGLPVSNSTHFAVTQYNRQFNYHLIGTSSSGSSRVGRYSSNQFRVLQGGTSAISGAVFPTGVVKLATVNNAASGGTTTAFVDGVQALSANLADPSSTGLVYKFLFRGDNDSSGALLYSEFIYYSSDQSANRAAIEANINNQYDIY